MNISDPQNASKYPGQTEQSDPLSPRSHRVRPGRADDAPRRATAKTGRGASRIGFSSGVAGGDEHLHEAFMHDCIHIRR